MKLRLCFLLVAVLQGCGYQPVYSGAPPAVRLAILSASNRVAEPVAIDAARDGARSVLAAEGSLSAGSGFPRLVLEVLRIDEFARGMVAQPDTGMRPVTSRGATVAVTVRGWVQDMPGGAPARDSGDVRRGATYAHRGDARFDSLARREAVRAAARDAGRAVARRVLGEAEPGVELL